ncbi:MAG TPA: hypothetical protein VL242_27155, partial [Sorangium sp.]|nr:hypothetical protein [Sorangium sp.]
QYSRSFWHYRLGSAGLIIASVILVLTAFSAQLFLTAAEQFMTSDARVLASHAISSEARTALRDSNAARFLALREASMHQTVERYFQRQGEWSADDSPSLASMIVSED